MFCCLCVFCVLPLGAIKAEDKYRLSINSVEAKAAKERLAMNFIKVA